jgi:hypothetical protein
MFAGSAHWEKIKKVCKKRIRKKRIVFEVFILKMWLVGFSIVNYVGFKKKPFKYKY